MLSHCSFTIFFFNILSQLTNDNFIEQLIIQKLKQLGNKITYKKNNLIFMQDAPGKFLHILESGRVKIVLESKRQQVVSVLQDNSIFGCIVAFNYNPVYPASAYSKEISIVNRIEKNQAESFIKNDPDLHNLWTYFIIKKTGNFAKVISNIHLNDATGKICYYILESVKLQNYRRECDGFIIEGISQATISNYTGLRRETINRILKKLINTGILDICNKKIIVKDLDKLTLFL